MKNVPWLRRFILAAAALFLASGTDADAQCTPPSGTRDVDFDSVAVFQFTGGASCWGWQASDGRQYAIMGGQRSIGFVDVQTMTVVDTVPTQPCSWRELKTYRNYCYAVSECTGDKQGMMIIDMRYLPDSVHYVGSYSSGTNIRSHCISIDTARGFCYLVRQNYSGFRMVSLANPEAPVDVGSVTTGDLHDMTAFNDTVYTAEGYNSSFSIWNCTKKSIPVMLAHVTIPGDGYVHNVWPTPDRHYLATTEEIPAGRSMKIWTIQNLGNISVVDSYLGPGQIPHNAHIEGDYLFLSHYSSGVSVLDLHDPEDAIEVALFDTYLANNNPSYVGCWGVYPHTSGSGWVYASNIDGRLFIFQFISHPFPASAEFVGTSLIGNVPLAANFTSCGEDLTHWQWTFGDGDSSNSQNPAHSYTQAGLFDVSLIASGPGGEDTMTQPAYVLALAETLLVADTGFDRGTSAVWDIVLTNINPISEVKIPITLSNVPGQALLDSISFIGSRIGYFESKQILYESLSSGQIVYRLRADVGGGSPALPPGSGPIARVHLRIQPSAHPDSTIRLTTDQIGFHALSAIAYSQTFTPNSTAGTATIGPPCDCSCHADPVCDGAPDVLDVVSTIAVAFRGNTDINDAACVHVGRTDVNCSGATDIVDVVSVILAAFRSEDLSTLFCNPCD